MYNIDISYFVLSLYKHSNYHGFYNSDESKEQPVISSDTKTVTSTTKKTPAAKAIKKTPNASVGAKAPAISAFFKKVEATSAASSMVTAEDEIGTSNILVGISGDSSPSLDPTVTTVGDTDGQVIVESAVEVV